MVVSKKFSQGIIFASATLSIIAGSINAPVLNLMRDALEMLRLLFVGVIITFNGLFTALSLCRLHVGHTQWSARPAAFP